MPPDEFVHHDRWSSELHAAAWSSARTSASGTRPPATSALLTSLGPTFGFTADGVPLLRDGEAPLSATYVRSCVQAGDVAAAAAGARSPAPPRRCRRARRPTRPRARLPDREPAHRSSGPRPGRRRLRRPGRPPGRVGPHRRPPTARRRGDLGRHQSDLRGAPAPGRGLRPRFRRRPLRRRARRRVRRTGCAAWSSSTASTRSSPRCATTSSRLAPCWGERPSRAGADRWSGR